MKKKTDLKSKSVEELNDMLKTETEALRKLTFGAGMTRVKDVKQGRTSKKLIAQLRTELAARA